MLTLVQDINSAVSVISGEKAVTLGAMLQTSNLVYAKVSFRNTTWYPIRELLPLSL